MNKKTGLLGILVISLLLAVIPIGLATLAQQGAAPVLASDAPDVAAASAVKSDAVYGVSETGLYIVRLSDPALASYAGGIAGLEATSPAATNADKVDTASAASQAYMAYLRGKHAEFATAMNSSLGRDVEVVYNSLGALNALTVRVSHAEAEQLAALPGVAAVYGDTIRELDTDVGPTHIGAPSIWNGNTGSGIATQGEGVIIGVIDSGINSQHPSFAETDGNGYTHINPYGSGVFNGWCVANPSFCNDKLIGAYGINAVGGNPEDLDGHGSHTASTAGGNTHVANFLVGTTPVTATISGVAPRANIVAYKVCDPGCPGSSSVIAVDHAILTDSVDVLNYSISGSDDPWNDPVDLAFLDAANAGIFVSASAGNDGPGASTVAKTGPWNAAVAAGTHGRIFANSVDVNGSPPPNLVGMAGLQGSGPALAAPLTDDVVYGGAVDPANIQGCNAWTGTPFAGQIALIQRGNCTFQIKVENATAAGAIGVIVFNNVGGPPIVMGGLETTTIPSVMLSLEQGNALRDYIVAQSPTPVNVTIDVTVTGLSDPLWADITGGFSSRGPSQFEILKPDYIAPGVNILAAVSQSAGDPVQYGFLQGTSMSSPHGAGAAALLVDLYPGWSPAQIKSAIASTAVAAGYLKEDGVTPAEPFDIGSGLINLDGASRVGLVFDETYANYVAANPDVGGDPKTVNQPSVVNYACLGMCSWDRTVDSVLPMTATYTATVNAPAGMTITVNPATFTIAPGGSQMLDITADVSMLPSGVFTYAEVILSTPELFPNTAAVADTRIPVVVVPAAAVLPTQIDITAQERMGTYTEMGLLAGQSIVTFTAESYGLTFGTIVTDMLTQDPSNGDPYNNLNDGTTFYVTTTVPAGAVRMIAETFDSEATDLDLFVGTGLVPSAGTELCASTTPTAVEICDFNAPAPGDYWILVQNWQQSSSAPDLTQLSYAVVTMDEGNMTVTGPNAPAATPFDIDVNWDEPAMKVGDRLYGMFTLGTDPANPGNLGAINVNLVYVGSPQIALDPIAIDAMQAISTVMSYPLTLENLGDAMLDWTITEGLRNSGATVAPAIVGSGPVSLEGAENLVTGATAPTAQPSVPETTAAVLYDQTANQTTSGTTSQFFGDFGGGSEAADDFMVPASDGAWRIEEVFVPGFYTGVRAGTSVNISFFADNGGVPAETPIYSANVTAYTDNGGELSVPLPTPVVLPAGHYWISAQNVMDFAPGNEQWFWFTSNVQTGDSRAFRDTADLFGTGCTTWGNYAPCLGPGNADLAFQILGTVACGVDAPWLSVSPTMGMLAAGESTTVDVAIDTNGLSVGSYSASLCVTSNDPNVPVVSVPVALDVKETANLQVVHLAPFAPGDAAVDVYANGGLLLSDFGYAESSGYVTIFADTQYDVEIMPTGTMTTVLTGTLNFMPGTDHTVIAHGGANGYPLALSVLLDNDPMGRGAGGSGYLRVGHLAPFDSTLANTAVDIYDDISNTAILTDVVYGAITNYMPMAPGTYDLSIRLASDGTTVLDLRTVDIADGDYVTAIAAGDGANQPLDVYAIAGMGDLPSLLVYKYFLPIIIAAP